MNDFVKVGKLLINDKPDFSGCQKKSFFSAGENCSIQYYKLKYQFTDIGINMNEASGKLIVNGNLGMFWNGHNLHFPFSDFKKVISYVSDKINVDLFPALVEELDHSATIKTLLNPKIIIQHHLDIPGHFTHPYKHGKYFYKEGIQDVKMYNAGMRMKQNYNKAMREKIYFSCGIDSNMNLIRFEKKIKHPKSYFKKSLTINDILHPDFILQCDIDLMNTYKSIYKTGSLQLPNNKKQLSSAILPLIIVKELEAIHGFNFYDLLKKRISAIDESILTKEDKKARRRQIKANLNKITGNVISEYDLSDQLAESLKMASPVIE